MLGILYPKTLRKVEYGLYYMEYSGIFDEVAINAAFSRVGYSINGETPKGICCKLEKNQIFFRI